MRLKFTRIAAAFAVAALPLLPSSAIQAQAEGGGSTVVVINNGQMGIVSIALNEYEYDNKGEEIPYIDNKMVTPGETVTKIARITNEAEKAWIRARLIWKSDVIKDLDDGMAFIDDGWIKRGGYYYYTKPVDTGSEIDFLKAVHIPEYWGNEYKGQKFQVVVQADAVQYVHFTPDFDSEDPWFGTPIEVSVYDDYYDNTKSEDLFHVIYKGGAEGMVRVGDDFFHNWGALMPGDVLSDTVEVKNEFKYPVTIYFSIDPLEDQKLSKAVLLTITDGDKVIFDGTLADAMQEKAIAELSKGDHRTLKYTITVPKELQNEYALLKTHVKWIFRADVHYPGKNTGTAGMPAVYGAVMLAAAGGIMLMSKKKKEGNDEA